MKKITDAMREAAPAPLYGCATQGCAEQKSVRAVELRWYLSGFYCELCIDGMAYAARQAQPDRPDDRHTGPTLAKLLADGKRAGVTPRQAPEPYYPCACHECAVEVSYPADMLAWCRDGFYCDECIGEMDSERDDDEDHTVTIGPDLADVLAQVPAAVPVEAPPLRYLGDTP